MGKVFGIQFLKAEMVDFFKQLALQIIDERKNGSSDVKRHDFLQLLLEAHQDQHELPSPDHQEANDNQKTNTNSKGKIMKV